MSEPTDFELLELATPYALHAMSDQERADIERRVAGAPAAVTTSFNNEVRAVRETMAVVSAATQVEPPARLREATLAAVKPRSGRRQLSWGRATLLSAAASIAVGAAAFGAGVLMRPAPAPTSVAEQVLAAPDLRAVASPLADGTATVMFSHDRNAGVLVMNNVPQPASGHVYQMWLINDQGPTSAGVMGNVGPSTTATLPDLGSSKALAFTVEPGAGSPQPTTPILAKLPLD